MAHRLLVGQLWNCESAAAKIARQNSISDDRRKFLVKGDNGEGLNGSRSASIGDRSDRQESVTDFPSSVGQFNDLGTGLSKAPVDRRFLNLLGDDD